MNVRKIHSWKYYVTPHVFSSGTTLSPCIDIFHQTFQSEPLVSSPRLWSELWNTRHKDTRLKKKKKITKGGSPSWTLTRFESVRAWYTFSPMERKVAYRKSIASIKRVLNARRMQGRLWKKILNFHSEIIIRCIYMRYYLSVN